MTSRLRRAHLVKVRISERVAGFILECLAGFVGIRNQGQNRIMRDERAACSPGSSPRAVLFRAAR
jgi:hypothetical protein